MLGSFARIITWFEYLLFKNNLLFEVIGRYGNAFWLRLLIKRASENRLSGKNCPKNKKDWKNVSNSSKFDEYNTQCNISSSRWLSYYSKIFSKLNHSVHSVYSKLLNICLPCNLSQRHVLTVSYDLTIKSVKRFKSKACDIDGISKYSAWFQRTEVPFAVIISNVFG